MGLHPIKALKILFGIQKNSRNKFTDEDIAKSTETRRRIAEIKQKRNLADHMAEYKKDLFELFGDELKGKSSSMEDKMLGLILSKVMGGGQVSKEQVQTYPVHPNANQVTGGAVMENAAPSYSSVEEFIDTIPIEKLQTFNSSLSKKQKLKHAKEVLVFGGFEGSKEEIKKGLDYISVRCE